MQTTVAPLSVEVAKAASRNAKKCAAETAAMLKDILNQLGYQGIWTLIMQCQISKKNEFKFQVTSRRNSAIVCRTKPGDNNTCWECLLVPPKGYLLEQVFSDLRTVPLNGKMLRIPLATPKNFVTDSTPEIFIPPTKSIVLETKKPVLASSVADLQNQVSEKPVLTKSKENFSQQALEFTQQPPIQENTTPVLEKPVNPLAFDSKISSLSENDVALLHGLVAVCIGIDPQGYHILRQEAIKLIVQELELTDFVKNHPQYSDPIKAGTIIMRGLCDKGLLSRWPYPQRKRLRRVRETTKGYILTPYGRERLDFFKAKMPESILERLFRPNKVVFQQPVAVLNIPEEEIEETLPVAVVEQPEKSTEKIDILTPLFEEYQRLNKSLEEIEVLGQEYEKQKSDFENQCKPFENRLETIKIEKLALDVEANKIDGELKALKDKREAVLAEQKSWEDLKKAETIALESVKEKLKKLID